MINKTYKEQIIEAWEEGYKKGILTFWVLAALADGEKHIQQIKTFITGEIKTNLEVDDKSLYRSVSRFKKMELIQGHDVPSPNGGPAYKVYRLTNLGAQALQEFTDRNIEKVFMTKDFNDLLERIKNEAKK